jgi:spore coat polysaccharide biosynthesis predicted glycosyltransferase SpsG
VVSPATDADVVVIDDPSPAHASARAARARRRGACVVHIADGMRSPAAADLTVDGRVQAPSAERAAHLSGPRFCVVDPRTRVARRPLGRRQGVLIALGGGVHVRHLAADLVAAITVQCPGVDIRVAAGLLRGQRPPLSGGRWLVRRHGLVDAMAQADVVVAGGGITLQESCAVGAATIGLAVVRAQRPAIVALGRRGAVVDGGGPTKTRTSTTRVARAVARLLWDGRYRKALATHGRRAIDGKGATRVARAIVRLVEEHRRG